jgi:hypothetical protein
MGAGTGPPDDNLVALGDDDVLDRPAAVLVTRIGDQRYQAIPCTLQEAVP